MKNKLPKTRLNKLIRFLKLKVLHTDDSPHCLALGVALGFLIGWTPLLGLHIILAVSLAALLRASKFTAIASVWISNPFTFVAIYYPNYLLGKKLLSIFDPNNTPLDHTKDQFAEFSRFFSMQGLFHPDFWQQLFLFLWQKGTELWIGSLVIAPLVAIAAYFITLNLITTYRKNSRRRLAH